MVQTKRADFNGLAKELGVSPVSVRIMRNRGMETKEAMERYLYGTLDGLYDGGRMKNMGEAVAVLIKKLREEKRIRIIGDYDIDGVCASYLLLTGLRRAERELGKRTGPAGSTRIDYEIPDRVRDGYGINEAIIRQAAADGVDTLVTCDNGIAAAKEISLAKELGMTVVVRSFLRRMWWWIPSRREKRIPSVRSAERSWPTSWWKSSMRRRESPGRNGGNSWNLRPLPLWAM